VLANEVEDDLAIDLARRGARGEAEVARVDLSHHVTVALVILSGHERRCARPRVPRRRRGNSFVRLGIGR
jgi:hypothetical protein